MVAEADWFEAVKLDDGFYRINERYVTENQSNIWALRGSLTNIIIDTGFGVRDLNRFLFQDDTVQLNDDVAQTVLMTHVHFDHSGGAHHFLRSVSARPPNRIMIHEAEVESLVEANQVATLNYVKDSHFNKLPFSEFSSRRYKVRPTPCEPVNHGQMIEYDTNDSIQVFHVPGHSKGSSCFYSTNRRILFTGDFMYNCGSGSAMFDWLPLSNVSDFSASCHAMLEWSRNAPVDLVCAGHFEPFDLVTLRRLMEEYITAASYSSRRLLCASVSAATTCYFYTGCFRVC